jgi:hypothetical protein
MPLITSDISGPHFVSKLTSSFPATAMCPDCIHLNFVQFCSAISTWIANNPTEKSSASSQVLAVRYLPDGTQILLLLQFLFIFVTVHALMAYNAAWNIAVFFHCDLAKYD